MAPHLTQNTRKSIKVVLSKGGTDLWVQYLLCQMEMRRIHLFMFLSSAQGISVFALYGVEMRSVTI